MATIEYIQRKAKPIYVGGKETDKTETIDVFRSKNVPDDQVATTIADLEAKGFLYVKCPHCFEAMVDRSGRHTAYDDPSRIRRAD